ncbi:MFS transporter [Desulfurivibrio dismutans]|uniref:MFS transporter n=1 Tax=Desulfurivibrio dismutans TaxID=1398908 RepID=UPI0023DA544A|nr:MFS transporter [Desulfurivibrio alkaliphilus]MDF1613375.1 MFS transporter [Desulfurivibrio alkaliphilus]
MSPTPPGHPAARRDKREIFGWAMFDFANQAYTLLIITVVFGDLFTTVIVGDRGDDYRLGNLLWSLALATSYFLVVLAGPVCGAVMDYTASKKRFLFASYLITVAATALLVLVTPGAIVLALVLIIVSCFAYSIGENFIASFLPELGPPEDLGKISGFGWALGYLGGLAAAAFTLAFLGNATAENFDRIRWVGPFAAGFFLIAALPTFLWLQERGTPQPRPPGQSYLELGLQRTAATLRAITQFRDLAIFLLSLFFAMAAIYIIISFTFIYGAQVIGWDERTRNLMFIVVQLTAAAGALGFGFLQDRLGAKPMYQITLLLWVLAIIAIWGTPQLTAWLNHRFGLSWEVQHLFLVVGCLAGVSLGATQSASRTLVGIFSPAGKSAEFFGFWGLTNKLAGMLGIAALGLLQTLVGLQKSILLCAFLFIMALVICLPVNQARGRAAAGQWHNHQPAKG